MTVQQRSLIWESLLDTEMRTRYWGQRANRMEKIELRPPPPPGSENPDGLLEQAVPLALAVRMLTPRGLAPRSEPSRG